MDRGAKAKTFSTLEDASHYFQGSVIDESGLEVPITQEMIGEACDSLAADMGGLSVSNTQAGKH